MTDSAYKGRNIRRENQSSGAQRGAVPKSGANVHNTTTAHPKNSSAGAGSSRRAAAGSRGAVSRRNTAAAPISDAKLEKNTALQGEPIAASAAKSAAKVKSKRAVTSFITVMSEQKYSFPVAAVFVAFLFTALVFTIVTASVRINDITADISALKSQITASEKKAEQLRMELETRDDLRIVENLARNEYGMVEADQVERYYLMTENSDRIEMIDEVKEQRENVLRSIPGVFDSVIERIRGIFGW